MWLGGLLALLLNRSIQSRPMTSTPSLMIRLRRNQALLRRKTQLIRLFQTLLRRNQLLMQLFQQQALLLVRQTQPSLPA